MRISRKRIIVILVLIIIIVAIILLVSRTSYQQTTPDNLHQQILKSIQGESAPRLVKEGQQLLKHGDADKALIYFEEAASLDRNYRDAWVLAGYAHILKNDYQGALKYLPRAVNLDPVYGFSHYLLYRAYSGLGQPQLAQEQLKKAEELGYRP